MQGWCCVTDCGGEALPPSLCVLRARWQLRKHPGRFKCGREGAWSHVRGAEAARACQQCVFFLGYAGPEPKAHTIAWGVWVLSLHARSAAGAAPAGALLAGGDAPFMALAPAWRGARRMVMSPAGVPEFQLRQYLFAAQASG
eukprot:240519-Chlamydomonas_euryale.AAC.1